MLDVKRNLTTMTDFYELTMSAGYLDEGYVDKIAVFDMFFLRVPDGGGYAVMAGLQQFIDAVDHLKFTDEDITYLRSTKTFDDLYAKSGDDQGLTDAGKNTGQYGNLFSLMRI